MSVLIPLSFHLPQEIYFLLVREKAKRTKHIGRSVSLRELIREAVLWYVAKAKTQASERLVETR